jgi:hypothetical protein
MNDELPILGKSKQAEVTGKSKQAIYNAFCALGMPQAAVFVGSRSPLPLSSGLCRHCQVVRL